MMKNQPLSEEEMKKLHGKKMIAPIIITVFIVVYYIGFAAICFLIPVPFGLRILFGIVPLALVGVILYVLIERIREIRSGIEDDLSQY